MNKEYVAWTVERLSRELLRTEEFEDGEISVSFSSAADVIDVELRSAGDIRLYMCVGEDQISTSVVLWARDDQKDAVKFEEMMLRNHKQMLPLSAIGITTIDGKDYYELFGAMSTKSTIQSIATEIRTLAMNAIELAAEIGPGASVAA